MCKRLDNTEKQCAKPDAFIVLLHGVERDRVCKSHKADYMVPKSAKLMKPRPGITFVEVMDDDRPPFRGMAGYAHMDAKTMQEVSARINAAGHPVVVNKKWEPSGTTYHINGVTKKNVKEILG